MKCFYQGYNRAEKSLGGFNGTVSFAIPDIGISFRAQFNGSQVECEYASLLALLEFMELNPHLFKNKRIEVFGNDYKVISQVIQTSKASKELMPYLNMAVVYRRKLSFTLHWIPSDENLAQESLSA